MRFYVYELIDPRTNRVFYVGKGTGDRLFCHERDARAGKVGPKCDLIREILAAGAKVDHRVVQEFSDETAAYAFEAELIDRHGLANLTNLIPGLGEGREFRWTTRNLSPHVTTVAGLLRLLAENCPIKLGEYDITSAIRGLVSKVVSDIGADKLRRILRKHGYQVA